MGDKSLPGEPPHILPLATQLFAAMARAAASGNYRRRFAPSASFNNPRQEGLPGVQVEN